MAVSFYDASYPAMGHSWSSFARFPIAALLKNENDDMTMVVVVFRHRHRCGAVWYAPSEDVDDAPAWWEDVFDLPAVPKGPSTTRSTSSLSMRSCTAPLTQTHVQGVGVW